MCSQPMEHDAQLSRATVRACARSSAASRGASAKVEAWKLRVGRVAIALKASRLASVPSSRYFAVAGPKDRARRSRAAARTAGGSAGAPLVVARAGPPLRGLAPSPAPPPPPPAGGAGGAPLWAPRGPPPLGGAPRGPGPRARRARRGPRGGRGWLF